MHSSEPAAYCSQQRCITAAQRFSSAALEEQPANVPLLQEDVLQIATPRWFILTLSVLLSENMHCDPGDLAELGLSC